MSSKGSVCKSLRKTGWIFISTSSSFWRRKYGLVQLEFHSSALRGLVKCAIFSMSWVILNSLFLYFQLPADLENTHSGDQLLNILISLWTALKSTFSWTLNFLIYCPVSVMLDNTAKILGKIRILQTPQKAAGCTEKTLWFKYPQAYLSHLWALKEVCSRILLSNYSAGRDCTYTWG